MSAAVKLPEPPYFDYTPAFEATAEVALGLLPFIDRMPRLRVYRKDTHPKHLRWMINQIVAGQDWPIDKTSRWLGYVQGVLTVYNVLDTVKERDRTRPLFHAAYTAMGFVVPKSRERSTALIETFIDPLACAYRWTASSRHFIRTAFLRGTMLVNRDGYQDRLRATKSSLLHNEVFGPNGAIYEAFDGLSAEHLNERMAFCELFFNELRKIETRNVFDHGHIAHLTGMALTALFCAVIGFTIIFGVSNDENIYPIGGIGLFLAGAASVIYLDKRTQRAWDKVDGQYSEFRKSLPWVGKGS